MSDPQYQTALSILFVGYVLMQVPSNAVLNYVGRPSLYIGAFVIIWGLVSLLTSQVHSYQSIVVCRFVLGLVEAPFVSYGDTCFWNPTDTAAVSRCSLLPFEVVHQVRTQPAHVNFLFWLARVRRLRESHRSRNIVWFERCQRSQRVEMAIHHRRHYHDGAWYRGHLRVAGLPRYLEEADA